jgi:hypothetical protein
MIGDLRKPKNSRGHEFESASPARFTEGAIPASRPSGPVSEPELEDDAPSARGWAADGAISREDEAWPDSDG